MNALTQLREAGHSVKLLDSNQIFVYPTPPTEWVPELRAMKPQIIEALKSEQHSLTEVLGVAVSNLPISSGEVIEALAPEDIEDWHKGFLTIETLQAFAGSLSQQRQMAQGIVPDHYTERAICKGCGPVWLWFSGVVDGCPWCWNKVPGRPIPNPGPKPLD